MPEKLTAEDYTKHLKTKFRVRLGEASATELELDEVTPLPPLSDPRGEVERFSLFFYGPGDIYLPQMIYRLEHEQLGELDIFLVPVARAERGLRYEAIFSYFK
jgi:hypothetical protein